MPRTFALLAIVALAGCAAPCPELRTTLAWQEDGLAAKTPLLPWGSMPSLPLPRALAGLPERGAAVTALDHAASNLTLAAFNATHARVLLHAGPADAGERLRTLARAVGTQEADAGAWDRWASEFAQVRDVPWEGIDGTFPGHVVHIPHAGLALERLWAAEDPVRGPSRDSWGSRHAWTGASAVWTVQAEEHRLSTGTQASARAFGHGLVHFSWEVDRITDDEARRQAREIVAEHGLTMPADARPQRSCG